MARKSKSSSRKAISLTDAPEPQRQIGPERQPDARPPSPTLPGFDKTASRFAAHRQVLSPLRCLDNRRTTRALPRCDPRRRRPTSILSRQSARGKRSTSCTSTYRHEPVNERGDGVIRIGLSPHRLPPSGESSSDLTLKYSRAASRKRAAPACDALRADRHHGGSAGARPTHIPSASFSVSFQGSEPHIPGAHHEA